jgi:DNA-binding CsgD family transcriptional regulator
VSAVEWVEATAARDRARAPHAPGDRPFVDAGGDIERVQVTLDAALGLLPEAAAVVDDDRRLVGANAAFRRLVRRGGALELRERVLCAVQPAVDARLEDRVLAVARGGAPRVLRVPLPAAREALELRFTPFRTDDARRRVAVVVHDPARSRAVCSARLRELYELTRAEAEVAARLADGCSLATAAAQLDVSLNTVRTHLRHLFAKCGVSTQAALLQRLALGAARVGAAATAAATEPEPATNDSRVW